MSVPERNYVEIAFTTGGRPYTYHVDGPVNPGDEVQVENRGALLTRTVLSVTKQAPQFNTKPAMKVG